MAEILFMLAGMSLIAGFAAEQLDLPTRGDRDSVLAGTAAVDWLKAAGYETAWQSLRFGLTFALILAIALISRRPSRAEAFLTRNGRGTGGLIAFGMGACLIAVAPVQTLHIVNVHYPFGGGTLAWAAIERSTWTWQFWLFMAASSFGLVAVLEELFFRSYALSRVRESFSDGGALLLVSFLFWISHGQYLQPDAFLLANSAAVIIGSLALGWVTLATGSIIPAITMHIMFNVPLTYEWRVAWVAAAVVLVATRPHRVAAAVRAAAGMIRETREWRLLIAMALGLAGLVWTVRVFREALLPLALLFGALAAVSIVTRLMARRPPVAAG